LKSQPEAILFVGILYADARFLTLALERLTLKFGPLRHESPESPWHSDHYTAELGTPIMRKFIFFRELVRQDELMDIKNLTRAIESELSADGRRTVNLDPGLLAPARVVLATTKDYAHRIYLGEGIFAEATLIYRDGEFRPNAFAYSDYTQTPVLRMFSSMRLELMEETREDKS